MARLDLTITPLNKQHDRKRFDCGDTCLNQYLRGYANQDIKRRVSRVFVASIPDKPEQVIGYYSLSAGSLYSNDLPESHRRRLPKYPVHVALLGRLAVAESHQGQGLGAILLADALRRVAGASLTMAIYAMVVDALNDTACEFYRRFGFLPLPGQPRKLFLPLDSVTSLID